MEYSFQDSLNFCLKQSPLSIPKIMTSWYTVFIAFPSPSALHPSFLGSPWYHLTDHKKEMTITWGMLNNRPECPYSLRCLPVHSMTKGLSEDILMCWKRQYTRTGARNRHLHWVGLCCGLILARCQAPMQTSLQATHSPLHLDRGEKIWQRLYELR